MTDREMLISMGFTPERVDWALRDTPAGADLQIRMDHILEHEAQTIPAPQTVEVTQKYGPPSHPPPQYVQLQAPPLPPRSRSPAPLIHLMDSMSINQKTKLQAPPLSPSSPFPEPPTQSASMGSMSINHASSLESDAVQRYAAFLVEHKEHLKEARTDLISAVALHTVITKFLKEEGEWWRNKFGLPAPTPEGSSSTPQRSHNILLSNQEDVQTAEQSAPVITVENAREQGEQKPTSDVYDPIAVYDPTRTLLPPLESIEEIRVVTGYAEDEPVENAKKRALEIHSRMSDEVSNLRWSSGIHDASPYDDAFNRRAEEHSTKLTGLHLRGDWDAANRLEREYSQREHSIRQQKNRADFQIYCREYLDPMTEKVHKALADIHPIYAEIKRYLEEDNRELDVVRAIAALEQVSETMELGMRTLAELEDERLRRELDLQRHIITNDTNRPDPFGDVSKLEKQHEFRILELKAHRTVQKVGRRAPFFALATRRIKEAIAWVDRDQELLQYHIRILFGTLHPTIPLEQEEYCASQGDTGPSRVPLPSKGLHNQIAWLQSLLWPVHAMTNDMRSVLHGIERKQIGEKREDDLAQLAASEARAGKGDNPYFDSRSIIRDRYEKEDAETEHLFKREREERREAFDMFMAPVGEHMTSYNDREALVLQRLAMDTTALEPVPPPSGNVSSGNGGNPTAALSEMQNFILQQQRMQMMADQHAMLCASISNMGSSILALV